MTILKVTKNQGFTLSLEDTFFEKPSGLGGGAIDLPAVLGLNSHKKSIQRSFFNTKIYYNNSSFTTKVPRRVTKLTPYWSSSIPERYKRNAVYEDLCRAERISSDFNNEKLLIRQKFNNAG